MSVRLPWQDEQWQRVDDLYQAKKLPHALLLSGPPGVGKMRFALAFAQYLMCESPKLGAACGECRQCAFNSAGYHPDVKLVSPEEKARQIKIDQVRSLVESLGHTSQQGGYKVSILAPAEAMNINAANALLKSLEEPSDNTLLLLISDSPGQLLPTIRSRCQVVSFPLPAKDQSIQWLTGLLPSQGPVDKLLMEAGDQPITALELVEGDGLQRREQFNKDFVTLLSGRSSAISLADKWMEYDISEVLSWLGRKLSYIISFRVGSDESGIDEHWRRMSQAVEVTGLFELVDKVNRLQTSIARGANPNKQLVLEELLLDSCEKFHV